MATLSVNLTETLDGFVEDRVASGEFRDASEVVGAGLTLLKKRAEREQRKLERLRAAIQVGIDEIERGEGEVVEDLEAWFDKLEAEVNRA
jgi:antitoxin ParD1/3/4